MNVVLFLLTENRDQISEFVATVINHKKIPFANYLIVADKQHEKEAVAHAKLLDKVAASTVVYPHVLGLKPGYVKLGSLLAFYVVQIYARHPGEHVWVDGTGVPNKEGWLETLRDHHRAQGMHFTGLFKINDGQAIPRGPLLVNAPLAKLKIFRFALGQDWRRRGQWLFARSCNNLHHKQFPFDLRDVPELSGEDQPITVQK